MKIAVIYFKKERKNILIIIKSIIKFFLLKKERKSSLQMVNENFIKSMRSVGCEIRKINSLNDVIDDEIIVCLGEHTKDLMNYKLTNDLIAGIGLMTHPLENLDFFKIPNLKAYLQHSLWTKNIYEEFINQKVEVWHSAIDTDFWKSKTKNKEIDFLIYKKFLWNNESNEKLMKVILDKLSINGLSYRILTYGNYKHVEYKRLLNKSKAMIFLCEHESQGLAYQEALSMNLPVLAWNQGYWLDPNWINEKKIQASSVPYFDSRCGETFKTIDEFDIKYKKFISQINLYKPREFAIEKLSFESSGKRFLEILKNIQSEK